jgi:hypothetical protein
MRGRLLVHPKPSYRFQSVVIGLVFLIIGSVFFVKFLGFLKTGGELAWLTFVFAVVGGIASIREFSCALWRSVLVTDESILVHRGFPLPPLYLTHEQWWRFVLHRSDVLDRGGGVQTGLVLLNERDEPVVH